MSGLREGREAQVKMAIRREGQTEIQKFLWSNVWGWLVIFPALFFLLWAAGEFDETEGEVKTHVTE